MKYKFFWSLIAIFHLFLVLISVSHLEPESIPGIVGKTIGFYGEMSGATAGYGFFAPGVGSTLRVKLFVTDAKGNEQEESLLSNPTNETKLRVGNLVDWFWKNTSDKEKRSFAGSWAAKAFSKSPDAKMVRVKVEHYFLPSLKRYRAGERPEWRNYYEATFKRRVENDA